MPEAAYPRPQFARDAWRLLDGRWDFSFSEATAIDDVTWTHSIDVPYPSESVLSGIGETGYQRVAWYRRNVSIPVGWLGKRVILHFGAVDHRAHVWVNGQLVARHEGGHTPFEADITAVLTEGEQVLVVRAEDDPHDLHKPRGKQDWREEPHSIWYPRTTGIWQSVWIEPVPEARIERARFTPHVPGFSIEIDTFVSPRAVGATLEVTLQLGDSVVAADAFHVTGRRVKRTIHLDDPGIDDARAAYLWSPETPNLIDVEFQLVRDGETLDRVRSYTALRSVAAREHKFHLNGRPYFLRLVLDQGYWAESLMSAPGPGGLKRDVELVKAMGFNGVRKHQKIEDPRYLYWADKLGLLVWEELPSAYAFSADSAALLTREWLEVLERDYNHPCIVAWVPFNESWGVPDLPHSAAQRNLVRALYYLTKSVDPTRPVVGNDGWEHVVSDMVTMHDYTSDANVVAERYRTLESVRDAQRRFRPGGRSLLTDEMQLGDQPNILSEFGGIRYSPEDKPSGWGYDEVESAEALLARYRALIEAASGSGLAGYCYTQFTDTFQEQNGLLSMDRQPKVPLESLARATKGGGG